jgi:hypothetical protein
VSNDDAANRRSDYGANLLIVEVGGQPFTSPGRITRMLQHQRALEVARAVESGCKLEMALKQGPGLLKNPEQVGTRVKFIDLA